MAEARYRLEVDWNGNGLFDHTLADIYPHVMRLSTKLGRDYGSQVYGRSIAGTLTAKLRDDDGTFARLNTTSPLYDLALPSRRVRLRMGAPTAVVRAWLTATSVLWPLNGTVQAGGDLTLPSGYGNINQVSWNSTTDELLIKKNSTSPFFSTFFSATGPGYRLSVYIENAAGTLIEMPYEAISLLLNNAARYNLSGTEYADHRTVLDGIASGQQSWFSIDRRGIVEYEDAVGYSTVWSGYLDSLHSTPQRGGFSVADLRALGVLSLLAERDADVPMQTSIGTGAALDLVLDAADIPTAGRRLDDGEATMERHWARGRALASARAIEYTEPGFIRESRDGGIVFEGRYHRATQYGRVSQATFSDDPGSGLPVTSMDLEDPIKDVANIVTIEANVYSVATAAVLWTRPGSAVQMAPGETLELTAEPEISGEAVVWTTPVSGTDWTANSLADGSGTNQTSLVTVTHALGSRTVGITVTNTSTTATVWLTLLQARGSVVALYEPSSVTRRDAGSVTRYGPRPYRFPPSYLRPDELDDFATLLIAQVRDAQPKVTLTVNATLSDDLLIQALLLEVSDRVSVIGSRASVMGLGGDFYIESEAHDVRRPGVHRTTYVLSPTETSGVENVIVLNFGPPLGTGILGR